MSKVQLSCNTHNGPTITSLTSVTLFQVSLILNRAFVGFCVKSMKVQYVSVDIQFKVGVHSLCL